MDEETENQLETRRKLNQLGYMDESHFKEHRNNVAQGLIRFGNTFAMLLGSTLVAAGMDDSIKIMRYWQQLCDQHAMIYKMHVAKEKAAS